jgi:FMN phosphatase YigB (HAD superfamily)
VTARIADKAVIVLDVGGVLIDLDLKLLFVSLSNRLGKEIGAPSGPILDELFLPVQTGEISFNDFIPALNSSLGISISPDEWRDLCCSIFTGEVPGMKEVILQLKSDYFLVALTNTIPEHWNFLLEYYPILELMDGFVVSYKERLAKPDPAIYQVVMDRYCEGRLPHFHTDDTPEYVEVARRLGWRSEVFTNSLQFKKEVLGSPKVAQLGLCSRLPRQDEV